MYKGAVPWYERLSMLGGTMGLLLGFSVITGFELLFFVFDYLYITIKYRCSYEYIQAVAAKLERFATDDLVAQ